MHGFWAQRVIFDDVVFLGMCPDKCVFQYIFAEYPPVFIVSDEAVFHGHSFYYAARIFHWHLFIEIRLSFYDVHQIFQILMVFTGRLFQKPIFRKCSRFFAGYLFVNFSRYFYLPFCHENFSIFTDD